MQISRIVIGRHVPRAQSGLGLQVVRTYAERLNFRRQPQTTCAFSPERAFSFTTVAVMPLYALMACAPKHKLTQKLIRSKLIYAVAGLTYIFNTISWRCLPDILGLAVGALSASSLPSMSAFAACFCIPQLTATAWLHLVVLDLFQARWVYLDGLKKDVQTAHSLVLCFMVGPLGLLSHLITRLFCGAQRRNAEELTL